MKILVFTSRYTASRDIISEDFGRQIRLFEQLGKLNHKVDFFCVDYKKFEKKDLKLHNINVFIRPFKPIKFFSFLLEFKKILSGKSYDIIISTSDPLWGVIGFFFSRSEKIKFIYDVQDNYLIYQSYKIPFFGIFERYVVRNSDLVICASNILTNNVKKIRKGKTITIPNGVDTSLFKPINKIVSRKKLSLPVKTKIISYIGSIQKVQGVDILIEAFRELKKKFNVKLLIVGRIGTVNKEQFDFDEEDILYLGSLSQKDVVYAINASDVLVIPYPKNSFTEVMMAPYKIVEFLACNKPIVITNVGEIKKLIKDKNMIAKPSDIKDLNKKIMYALKVGSVKSRQTALKFDWERIASVLNKKIK